MTENVLIINLSKNWFGGAYLFIEQYSREHFQGKGIFMLEQYREEGASKFALTDRQTGVTYRFDKDDVALTNLTRHLGITSVFINHLVEFDLLFILNWIERSGLPYEYFIHDSFCICSNHLLTCFANFCSENMTNPLCRWYFRNAGLPTMSVEQYRDMFNRFLSKAAHVYSPSSYAADMVKKYFPDLKIEVRPHHLALPLKKTFKPLFALRDKLRIVFLGSIAPLKGEMHMEAANELIRSTDLPIELVVLGTCRPHEGIKVHGRYDSAEVSDLLAEYETSIVATMSCLHETYCYTASEAILSGYPVLALNIGAHSARIEKHDCGWLMPFNSPSRGIEIVTLEGRRQILLKADNTSSFQNGME